MSAFSKFLISPGTERVLMDAATVNPAAAVAVPAATAAPHASPAAQPQQPPPPPPPPPPAQQQQEAQNGQSHPPPSSLSRSPPPPAAAAAAPAAITTATTTTATAAPPPSQIASHPEQEQEPEMMMMDDDSVLSDVPPDAEHMPMPTSAHPYDGPAELNHDQEPNPKKRKRYNDPPNEVHAELRRPQLPGQWYSKTPEQWEELSHLHKLIYSHVGRIEETDLGEEVEPCEACRKRGFKCMKYKQDHPEVEKLYKGNVRVGTSCTRCRRYRRTCALPGKKPNGTATTPNRPQPLTNGYDVPASATSGDYKAHGLPERDTLDTWENTLLAAASGGSPLTSVASSNGEYPYPHTGEELFNTFLPQSGNPQHAAHLAERDRDHHRDRDLPPHAQHTHSTTATHNAPGAFEHDGDLNATVAKVVLHRMHAYDHELKELRASHAEFAKERRDWADAKRDMQAEIYHLREEGRKAREDNWALQTKVAQLEKDALAGRGADVERIMAEAELKVENRQLSARVEVLGAQRKEARREVKELKRVRKGLKRQVRELRRGEGGDMGPPPPPLTTTGTAATAAAQSSEERRSSEMA